MKKKLLSILFLAMLVAILCILSSCDCKHSEVEKKVTREPTCSTPGLNQFVCLECGEHLPGGNEIETIEHSYVLVQEKAPTCDEVSGKGHKEYQCTECKTYKLEDIPALDHQWTEATCTANKTCTVCNTTEGWSLGHDYTETTDGTCTRCGFGVTFILPTTPVTIYTNSSWDKACIVENIKIERVQKYSYSTPYYELTLIIQSTYHEKGSNYSDQAYVAWKLYDEDGIVVDSGTVHTANITVGETTKGTIEFSIGDDYYIQDGKTYRLELHNIG